MPLLPHVDEVTSTPHGIEPIAIVHNEWSARASTRSGSSTTSRSTEGREPSGRARLLERRNYDARGLRMQADHAFEDLERGRFMAAAHAAPSVFARVVERERDGASSTARARDAEPCQTCAPHC